MNITKEIENAKFKRRTPDNFVLPNIQLNINMDADINEILKTIFKVLNSTYKESVDILNNLMRPERTYC